ncbi:hypothetical protein [Variovorax boronicumulans]|uniref:hypothetical protein n=1 Tax=Variovorax boronicumulans TaxID=436515 RepID=UPI00117F85CD|nr:hypothetical protein [Variovorax boronicumulans]
MSVEPAAQNTALGKKPEGTVSMLHLSCVAGRAHAAGTLNTILIPMTPFPTSRAIANFSSLRVALCFLLAMFILSGCAVHPKIAADKVRGKSTVTIIETPPLKNLALIGVMAPYFDFHFSSRSDMFFSNVDYTLRGDYAGDAIASTLAQQTASPPVSRSAGASSLVAAGLVGALIQASADGTQRKAQGFDREVRKLFPDWNPQQEFMDALLPALRQRGMQPVIASRKTNTLLWPASKEDGERYRSGSLDDAEPTDSEMLLQISPIAFWNAPGPLNEYRMNVSVGMAMYDAKTKAFLGRQTIIFDGPSGKIYPFYTGLVSDLASAQPRLRLALLSLAPKVADVASGKTAD